MSADIAAAYGDATLLSRVRDLPFDRKSGALRLTDTYRFSETPSSVTERFIATTEPKLTDEGTVTVTSGGETLTIDYDAARLTPKVHTETEVWSTGRQRVTYLLDFELKNGEKEFSLTFDFT